MTADGFETVSFPWAGEPSTPAPTEYLMRAPDDMPAEAAAPPGQASAPPPPVPAQASQAAPDLDEVYEHVVLRLRRELLADRERMGDLVGDLP